MACGMRCIATRERRVACIMSRRRTRSIHAEQAMIAPLTIRPPLKVRLEKSPIMPSRLK